MPADSNPPSHPVAGRSAKAIGLFVTLLLICLTADLALKAWSFNVWPDEPVEIKAVLAGKEHLPDIHMVIVPKILALKLTLNRGAVFGVMQGQQIAFIIATILTIGFVGWFFVRSDARHSLFHIALAMILAGALGNLYDRVTYGAVRDMLWLFPSVNLPFGWTWPGGARELYPWIFNLADAFLLIGIGLIILRSAFQPDQAPAEQPAPAPSSTNTK